MNVLVLGSSGYIGSVLAKELEKCGHNVLYYDQKNHPPRRIEDQNIFKYIVTKSDIVFHLASPVLINESKENPYKYWKGVYGTTNIVYEACEIFGKKLIYISTQVVGDDFRCQECGQHLSPYASAKAEAEKLVLKNPSSLVFRLPNVYDFEDLDPYKERLVPRLSNMARNEGTIKIYPPLDTKVNLLEVHMCAKQLIYNMDRAGLIVLNGETYTIEEVAKIIASKYNAKVEIVEQPQYRTWRK